MKFKLEDLKKHPNRCIEKLSNEIKNSYSTRVLVSEKEVNNFCLEKATDIISQFLDNKLIDSRNNKNDKFGIIYCEDNNLDIIELNVVIGGGTSWAAYTQELSNK